MIAVNAQGTASASRVPRLWGGGSCGGPRAPQRGGNDYRSARAARDLIVQSQLIGVPPTCRRRSENGGQAHCRSSSGASRPRPSRTDTIRISLDRSSRRRLQRRREGSRYVVERGVISLNAPTVLPEREGISSGQPCLRGRRPVARLLGSKDETGSRSRPPRPEDSGARFQQPAPERRRPASGRDGGGLRTSLKGLAGEIAWRPEGRGRIVAAGNISACPTDPGKNGGPGARSACARHHLRQSDREQQRPREIGARRGQPGARLEHRKTGADCAREHALGGGRVAGPGFAAERQFEDDQPQGQRCRQVSRSHGLSGDHAAGNGDADGKSELGGKPAGHRLSNPGRASGVRGKKGNF